MYSHEESDIFHNIYYEENLENVHSFHGENMYLERVLHTYYSVSIYEDMKLHAKNFTL